MISSERAEAILQQVHELEDYESLHLNIPGELPIRIFKDPKFPYSGNVYTTPQGWVIKLGPKSNDWSVLHELSHITHKHAFKRKSARSEPMFQKIKAEIQADIDASEGLGLNPETDDAILNHAARFMAYYSLTPKQITRLITRACRELRTPLSKSYIKYMEQDLAYYSQKPEFWEKMLKVPYDF